MRLATALRSRRTAGLIVIAGATAVLALAAGCSGKKDESSSSTTTGIEGTTAVPTTPTTVKPSSTTTEEPSSSTTAAPTTASSAAPTAPCTKEALQAAVPEAGGATITAFGCDAGWAWASGEVAGPDGYAVTLLSRASGSVWVEQDRAAVCGKEQIPPDVYDPGCTTS